MVLQKIFHLILFYPRARQASAKESALDYDHIGTFMNQPPPRTRSLILIDINLQRYDVSLGTMIRKD